MKNSRNRSMVIGNKVFTNMTAVEVKKLQNIMCPPESGIKVATIGIQEYIDQYKPRVREWTSKKGTSMITVEILHDVIDHKENEMSLPKDGMHRNNLFLK